MTDYFEEMGWQEHANIQEHQDLMFARMLIEAGYIMDADIDSPPASKEAIANLDRRTIECDESDEKCAICLAQLKKNDTMVKMPCKHEFHEKCILPWLQKRNTCPQCRFEMKTDNQMYEKSREYRAREPDRQHDIEVLHNSMFS